MKMMPGQTPYTPEELKRLQALVGSALVAVEVFGEDELEWYAKRKEERVKKDIELPVARPVRSKTVIGIGALGAVRPETKPTIALSDCEPGNIFSVMARCRTAAQTKGWTQQQIGDFRGNLFRINNNESYEEAMKFVGLYFEVKL